MVPQAPFAPWTATGTDGIVDVALEVQKLDHDHDQQGPDHSALVKMGHDLDVLLGHVQALGSVVEVPLRQALGTPV